MASELFVLTLVRAQVAVSLAVLLVLILRAPARRLIGACLTYRLWLLAPAAALASLFPTLSEFLTPSLIPSLGAAAAAHAGVGAIWFQALTLNPFWSRWAPSLALVWAIGALGMASLVLAAELRFRRLARLGLAGPALMGVAAPRFVTPHDYRQRFTQRERDLIRRHERTHAAQGDPLANLTIAGFQVLFWFNPLIHLASAQIRLDQELACDALVVEGRPSVRRAYAQALLKAHLTSSQSALVCAWSPTAGLGLGLGLDLGASSPLERRLQALSWGEVSLARYTTGLVAVGALAVGVAATVWIAAPGPRYDASVHVPTGRVVEALQLDLAPGSPR